MYVPEAFAEPDVAAAYNLIEGYPFGILIVGGAQGLNAAHIPFLLDRGPAPHGALRAHVARSNPIWRDIAPDAEVLAVFQGPHGYISPDWYASPGRLPTWNYVAVHAYGPARLLGEAETHDLLRALTHSAEAALAPKPPWSAASLDPEFFGRMAAEVVGFEIAIGRLEAKAKMGQNRSLGDVDAAVTHLSAREEPWCAPLAEAMEHYAAPRRSRRGKDGGRQ